MNSSGRSQLLVYGPERIWMKPASVCPSEFNNGRVNETVGMSNAVVSAGRKVARYIVFGLNIITRRCRTERGAAASIVSSRTDKRKKKSNGSSAHLLSRQQNVGRQQNKAPSQLVEERVNKRRPVAFFAHTVHSSSSLTFTWNVAMPHFTWPQLFLVERGVLF